MDQSPRQEISIHQSLHKPMLVLGGERNLVLMLGVLAGIFIFSLAQLWAAVIGIILWVFGTWGLAQLAKYDPILSKTGSAAFSTRNITRHRPRPLPAIAPLNNQGDFSCVP